MPEVDSIAAQELRAAGIDATFQGLSVNAWNQDVANGDFPMTSHWSNGGITPYNMYDGWLNSSLASGSAAIGDYERLNNPTINAELATLAGAVGPARRPPPLVPLEQYVAANLPVIPITTAPEWFEYNSQNYTGWPSQRTRTRPASPPGTTTDPAPAPTKWSSSICARGAQVASRRKRARSWPISPARNGPHPTITLTQPA